MDGLGTVQHNFHSHFMDMHMKHTNEYNKTHKTKKPDRTFRIKPLWSKAFSGREELLNE